METRASLPEKTLEESKKITSQELEVDLGIDPAKLKGSTVYAASSMGSGYSKGLSFSEKECVAALFEKMKSGEVKNAYLLNTYPWNEGHFQKFLISSKERKNQESQMDPINKIKILSNEEVISVLLNEKVIKEIEARLIDEKSVPRAELMADVLAIIFNPIALSAGEKYIEQIKAVWVSEDAKINAKVIHWQDAIAELKSFKISKEGSEVSNEDDFYTQKYKKLEEEYKKDKNFKKLVDDKIKPFIRDCERAGKRLKNILQNENFLKAVGEHSNQLTLLKIISLFKNKETDFKLVGEAAGRKNFYTEKAFLDCLAEVAKLSQEEIFVSYPGKINPPELFKGTPLRQINLIDHNILKETPVKENLPLKEFKIVGPMSMSRSLSRLCISTELAPVVHISPKGVEKSISPSHLDGALLEKKYLAFPVSSILSSDSFQVSSSVNVITHPQKRGEVATRHSPISPSSHQFGLFAPGKSSEGGSIPRAGLYSAEIKERYQPYFLLTQVKEFLSTALEMLENLNPEENVEHYLDSLDVIITSLIASLENVVQVESKPHSIKMHKSSENIKVDEIINFLRTSLELLNLRSVRLVSHGIFTKANEFLKLVEEGKKMRPLTSSGFSVNVRRHS